MAEDQEKKQPVHRGGQPELPGDNPKPPKRVVRTYQEDLARMSKNMTPEQLAKHTPKERPQKKKEGLVTPPQPPQKKPEVRKESPAPQAPSAPMPQPQMDTETKKHYVEEIRATDTIEITKGDTFTKADLDHAGEVLKDKPLPKAPTPPKQTPPPAPMQKREPATVIMEDSSAPQQNIFASIMAWLLGGTGNDTPQKSAPKPIKDPVAPPKKLESIPVAPKAPERKVEEAPLPPKPEPMEKEVPKAPEAPPVPAPKPMAPPEAPKKNPLFAAPKPKEEKPIAPIVPPRPERRPEDIPAPSPIQTYTSDARKGIKEQKATPLSVLAKQQDAKKAPPKRAVQTKKSSFPLIAGGALLLVLGIGVILGTYLYLQPAPAPQPTSPRIVTPVFAEDRVRVSASSTPTIEAIRSVLPEVPAPQGSFLTHITFADESGALIPFSDILLNSRGVPGVLARSIYPQSMFGVFGEDKEPVAVLAVSSFERSFRSMLSWEEEMVDTLEPIFGTLLSESTGTTTPVFIPRFIDEEIGTTDARILYDINGIPHIIYGFVDANILFITQSKETFRALRERIVRE